MRKSSKLVVVLAALTAGIATTAAIQTAVGQKATVFQPKSSTGQSIPTRPPGPRLGPRYRSPEGQAVKVPMKTFDILAPEDTPQSQPRGVSNNSVAIGRTSSPTPALLWYLRNPAVRSANFFMKVGRQTIDGGILEPGQRLGVGLHTIRIADLKIPQLRENQIGTWWLRVALPDGTTAEAGSLIIYVPLEPSERPEVGCKSDAVCVAEKYAAIGYWYDALSALAPIGNPPTGQRERELWNTLLSEVGFAGEDKLPE